jgi:hypothetical protein
MPAVLIEIGTWLPTLPSEEGGDGTADVGDGAEDRTRSNDMVKTFHTC